MLLARSALVLAGLAGLAMTAHAQQVENTSGPSLDPRDPNPHGAAGQGYWSARLGYYDKDDPGEGNPFVDESVTVIEPIFVYDYQASDDFGYNIQLSYDNVSSASIERLNKFDGQSGASGDNYVGLDAAFRHKLDENTNLNWHAGFSFEYDYFSIGLGGGLSQTLEPQDAVISANINAYFDTVGLIRYNGVDEGDDNRTSIAGTVSWYQVINPTTHGEFGLTLSSQSGYLESPVNAVVLENPADPPNANLANNARGFEFGEELPDSRFRTAIYGKVRHALSDRNALEFGARLYNDDWGVQSYDFTPKYIHQFDGGLLWDIRYRYYSQTAADAYQANFTGATLPAERTQDSELAEFDSNLLGTHLRWGQKSQWDFGLDFLSRSDGLDHMFFSVGLKKSF